MHGVAGNGTPASRTARGPLLSGRAARIEAILAMRIERKKVNYIRHSVASW